MKSSALVLVPIAVALAIGAGVILWRAYAANAGPTTAAVRGVAPVPEAADLAPDGRPILVELGMNSCASCKAMHRVLDELRTAHGEHLRVIAVDIREQPELVGAFRVMAIPTQVLLDGEGREIGRHLGFLSADAIRERFAAQGLPLAEAAGTP
jgi:thioredoxin 1